MSKASIKTILKDILENLGHYKKTIEVLIFEILKVIA